MGLAATACSSDPQRALVPQPPMLLAADPGCALYVGGVYGNDEMGVRLVLCAAAPTVAPAPGAPPPPTVTGTIQYISPLSGWSVRRVAGGLDPAGNLVLADTLFVEQHPSIEFQMCLVERYTLRMSNDGVVDGEYISTPCHDHARIALERAVQ